MDKGVGTILRAARERRQIELSGVEAATRIRQRYLRAIENEEWDVLPGAVYARGFVRAYASFLGLDGERLVADYRRTVEGVGRQEPAPAQPAASGPPVRATLRGRRPPRFAGWIAAAVVLALAALVIVVSGGSGGGGQSGVESPGRSGSREATGGVAARKQPPAGRPGVSVRLVADAEVWVCLLDAGGGALVEGQILEAGAEEGPFRSGSFTVSFGNGEVTMLIDGREAEIPATSSPIGYSIDASGALTELSETERPTCA